MPQPTIGCVNHQSLFELGHQNLQIHHAVTPSFQNTPEHFRNDIHQQNEGVPGFIHASFLVSQPRGLFQLLGCAQLVHKHHNLLRDWRRVQVIHARVPYLTLFVNRKAHCGSQVI